MIWLTFVAALVVRLGVLGAALTVVKKGDARGGYALAAAAGVSILCLCCLRGIGQYMSTQDFEFERERTLYAMTCVDALQPLLVTALLAASIFLLAKAAKAIKPAA